VFWIDFRRACPSCDEAAAALPPPSSKQVYFYILEPLEFQSVKTNSKIGYLRFCKEILSIVIIEISSNFNALIPLPTKIKYFAFIKCNKFNNICKHEHRKITKSGMKCRELRIFNIDFKILSQH